MERPEATKGPGWPWGAGSRLECGGPWGPPLTPSHCARALPQSVWVKTGALQWWCDWKPHKWVDVHVALEQLTGNDAAQDSILFIYYVVHEEKKVGRASWRGGGREVGGLPGGSGAVFRGGVFQGREWGGCIPGSGGSCVPDEEAGSGGRVSLPPGLGFEPNQPGSKH